MRSAKKLGDEDGLFQTSKEMYEVMGDDIESLRNLIQLQRVQNGPQLKI